MDKPITIAIDGFSGCGKSSLARELAARLGYRYVDTGAMYRAVTLYFIQNKIDLDDEQAVTQALDHIHIDFLSESDQTVVEDFRRSAASPVPQNLTMLNGEVVEQHIRSLEVSKLVSPVATLSTVRRAMVAQQRRMGSEGGVVMDGRDIGTVVFPQAELKFFLVADMDIRANRRLQELQARGLPADLQQVTHILKERDRIDSTRADSPLRQAEDAIVLDNSQLGFDELVELAMSHVRQVIG